MAPKAANSTSTKAGSSAHVSEATEYPTIAAKLEAEYLASRPYHVLKDTKGLASLTPAEKKAYAYSRFLETRAWRTWSAVQQKDFWKSVESQKIPTPLPKPASLGQDSRGVPLGEYTPREYALWQRRERDLGALREKSCLFREKRRGRDGVSEEEVQEERNRRKLLGNLRGAGKRMGRYEGDPAWDDVVPIAQDDGEAALAAIAYTDEYTEAMGYLRAIMAAREYSPRVLELTEHIISMNAAHYTVWLYRAQTLLSLDSSIPDELQWMNDVAMQNQKNYQVWGHRQALTDTLYTRIENDPKALQQLAETELDFMTRMFEEDGKNYHVWSYRQYFVRKLNLFSSPAELKSIEKLLRSDIRNNSAWSHRFFLVFSNPEYCSPDSKATAPDPAIPASMIDRELDFAKAATYEAPQNQSPWNYLRGVLTKGGRKLASEEAFAKEFVRGEVDGDGDVDVEVEVLSSHALDLLADIWAEKGETGKAEVALKLLGDKYDRIRKNYWEWRRALLVEGKQEP